MAIRHEVDIPQKNDESREKKNGSSKRIKSSNCLAHDSFLPAIYIPKTTLNSMAIFFLHFSTKNDSGKNEEEFKKKVAEKKKKELMKKKKEKKII